MAWVPTVYFDDFEMAILDRLDRRELLEYRNRAGETLRKFASKKWKGLRGRHLLASWRKLMDEAKAGYRERWEEFNYIDLDNIRKLAPEGGTAPKVAMALHYSLHASDEREFCLAAYCLDRLAFAQSAKRHFNRRVFDSASREHIRDASSRLGVELGCSNHDVMPFDLELPAEADVEYHYTNPKNKLLGRDQELAALREFRDLGPGFRWWQISGDAGQGKSALALKFVKETAELSAWAAGFIITPLDPSTEGEMKKKISSWKARSNVLLVVDDIISKSFELRLLLSSLSTSPLNGGFAVLVVIVERDPWHCVKTLDQRTKAAGWFEDLFSFEQGPEKAIVGSNYHFHARSVVDKSLHLSGLDEKSLIAIASSNIAQASVNDDNVSQVLSRIDGSGRPLYAIFAGLALSRGKFEVLESAESLLDWVLEIDRRKRWFERFPSELGPPSIGDFSSNESGIVGQNPSMHLAVLATILRTIDCNELVDISESQGWAPHNRIILLQSKAIASNELTYDPEPIIDGLRPDILGEWFVLRSIEKQRRFLALISVAWKVDPISVADFFVRIATDFPERAGSSLILSCLPDKSDASANAAYVDRAMDLTIGLWRGEQNLDDALLNALSETTHHSNALPLVFLANRYENGQGGFERSPTKSAKLYAAASNLGNSFASQALGLKYFFGNGVPVCWEAARGFFEKSMFDGNVDAKAALSLISLLEGNRYLKPNTQSSIRSFNSDFFSRGHKELFEWRELSTDGRAKEESLSLAISVSWPQKPVPDMNIVGVREYRPSCFGGLTLYEYKATMDGSLDGEVAYFRSVALDGAEHILGGQSFAFGMLSSKLLNLESDIQVIDFLKLFSSSAFADGNVLEIDDGAIFSSLVELDEGRSYTFPTRCFSIEGRAECFVESLVVSGKQLSKAVFMISPKGKITIVGEEVVYVHSESLTCRVEGALHFRDRPD